MNKKASGKDGADEGNPKEGGDVPGIPQGEELILGPLEGEEIDPLPKWWSEPMEVEKPKRAESNPEEVAAIEAAPKRPLRPVEEAGEALGAEERAAKPSPDELEHEPPAGREKGESDLEAIELPREEAPKGKPVSEIDLGTASSADDPSDEGGPARKPKAGLDELLGEDGPGGKVVERAAAEGAESLGGKPALPPKLPPPLPKDGAAISEAENMDKARVEPMPMPKAMPKAKAKKDLGDLVVESANVTKEPEAAAPPTDPEVVPVEKIDFAAALASDQDEAEADAERGTDAEDLATGSGGDAPDIAEDASGPEASGLDLAEDGTGPGEPLGAGSEGGEGSPTDGAVAAPVRAKARAGCWTLFATLYFFASLLLVVALVVAGLFAGSLIGSLGGGMASSIESRLAEQGMHLGLSGGRYEFPRGLVFDEATFYDDATKARRLLKVEGFGVNVDPALLFGGGGEGATAELSLRDSRVELFSDGEPYSRIEAVDGEIFVGPEEIAVERLSARVGGLRLRIEGKTRLSGKGGGVSDAGGGESKPSLSALDFSGFASLAPWLSFESVEGGDEPMLRLSFAMDSGEPELATVEGGLKAGPGAWRGLAMKGLEASFALDPASGMLRFPAVLLVREEGSLSGALALDLGTQVLQIDRVQSTVDPLELLGAWNPAWIEPFQAIRLLDAPFLALSGSVPLEDPAAAEIELRYAHRKGFVHESPRSEDPDDGVRALPLSDLRGSFAFKRGVLESNDAAATLFGGHLRLNGTVNFTREGRPFNGLAEIVDLPLDKAAPWLGPDAEGLGGRLFLSFRGSARQTMNSLNGGGRLRIDEAGLAAFPVVGSLQRFIGGIVPVFGGKASGSLEGAYILESGVLVTSDLTLRNQGARLVTNGTLYLDTMEARVVATADLEPTLAAAVGLSEKAIVVDGSGPVAAPKLKLSAFPVGFASAAAGKVLGTSPETLAGLKELVVPGLGGDILEGALGEGGLDGLEPEVSGMVRELIGSPEPPAEERPVLRAVPESPN
jgi:hypothetical protein